MAQKLNKKLLFVVSAIGVSLVALGVFAYAWKLDTDRFIRAGDKLTAEGDFRKAADAYGRAVSKKPNNLAYLDKFSEAILRITPETQSESTERYLQHLGVLQMSARADRDNIDRWRVYLSEIDAQCEASSSAASWKSLAERCDDMLSTVRPDGVEAVVAKAYRGYAGMRRLDSLEETQRVKLLEDLNSVVGSKDLNPLERDFVSGAIARIAIDNLARAKGAGRTNQLESARAAAVAALAQAQLLSPDGVVVATAVLDQAIVEANGNFENPSIGAACDALAAAALKSGDPMQSLTAVNTLVRGGAKGVDAAKRVCAAVLEKQPEQILHRRILAMLLRNSDSVEAMNQIQLILDTKRPSVGLLSASYEGNQVAAAVARFDMLYDQVERASGDERTAAIARLVSARADLDKAYAGTTDSSPLLRSDGKLASASGKFADAVIKFNEVFKKGSEVDLELYLLAAFANLQLGETGRALDLVNGGLQMVPRNAALLKLRAQLEVRAGYTTEALATVRLVLDNSPTDAEAIDLEKGILAALSQDPVMQTEANSRSMDGLARIQEALELNDFGAARRYVESARTQAGTPDVRIERYAIAVEVQAGEAVKAKEMTAAALAMFPDDGALVRFNALFSSDDPVERIVILTAGTLDDPKLIPIMTYLRVLETSLTIRENANRERRLGQASATASEAAASKLEAGAVLWRAKAEAADRTHPILIEADFRDALTKKDFAAAAVIVKLAQDSKRDPAQAVLLESQVLSEQGKLREATVVLEAAIQSGIDSSVVFRALGATLEQSGSIEAARRQYEEAYKRRPNDMQTVRLIVGAAMRGGNTTRALEVLRQARQLAGLDEQIGDTWLNLEAQAGDRRLAQRMRENQYRIAAIDLKNALALANLLATSAPEREDVLDERGQPSYSNTQWQGLDANAQMSALEKTRAAWRRRAEEIYLASLKREPGNLDLASAYANMLRVLGRRDEAGPVLAAAVAASAESAGWRGHVMLGNLYTMMAMNDLAAASFAEAIKREDPAQRDASKSIVDMLFNTGRYEAALVYLEPIAKTATDLPTRLRYAELQLRSGQINEARTTFDAATLSLTRDGNMEMLDGAISTAKGDALRATGRMSEAMAAYETGLAPYSRAKILVPFAPQPFIQDSMLKRKLFEMNGSAVRGQEALAAADRAVVLGGSLMEASAIRSEVLIALGDTSGAVSELERFLRLSPGSVEARRRLTDLLERSGNIARAEDSARAAVSMMPGEPKWQIALGDILFRQQKYGDAGDAYKRADILSPDPVLFFREVNSRVRAKDYDSVISASRRRADLVRTNSTAKTYVGIALIGSDDRTEGIKTLRETYIEARTAFEGGNVTLLGQWYEAVELLYQPTELAAAESALIEFSKGIGDGSLDPLGRGFLATLSMGSSAGPSKAVEYLAPLATADFSKNAEIGAMLLDKLGTMQYASNDCAGAVKTFETALALTPNAGTILNNYAYLCGECLKDAKKGLPSARLAVQLNPERSEYLDTLGTLLCADNQLQDALDTLKRAVLLANAAPVHYHLGQVYKAMGRLPEARASAEEALKLKPDPQTKQGIDQLLTELK